MTAVAPKVLRAENAEQTLLGKMPTDSVLHHAAGLVVKASRPHSDLNASEEYRRTVLHTLVKESLGASYERATAR
jgi:CO/xanthine dehydrogenase FAD-binding subunit